MIINNRSMDSPVKKRLKEFISLQNIKGSDFCKTIGVSSGFISGMRESIQPDKLESIAINYPLLNIGWLMTGIGEMIKSESTQSDNSSIELKNNPTEISNTDIHERLIEQLEKRILDKEEIIKSLKEQIELLKHLKPTDVPQDDGATHAAASGFSE